MSESFNIDQVVECVKNIVDSIRCPICDKVDGSRVRYSCGHVACSDCVGDSDECLFCLTPPKASSLNKPVLDEILTQRVVNAVTLLNVCQETFSVDVYRRRKISERLKVEKELFPECIQAPLKYSNKRKSSNTFRNTENYRRSIIPGENTSLFDQSKMEKSMNFVKEWLNHNDKLSKIQTRKPFADINVNSQQFDSKQKPIVMKRRADIILDKVKQNNENISSKGTSRKRSARAIQDDQTHLHKYRRPNDKVATLRSGNTKKLKGDISFTGVTDISSESKNKPDKDESGIVIEDETVIIDDSQDQIIDKDKDAWLAVLKAHKNEETNSDTVFRLECSEVLNYTNDVEKSLSKSLHNNNSPEYVTENLSLSIDFDNKDNKIIKTGVTTKVPFYKKAYLFDDCNHSYNEYIHQNADDSNRVSVTVENDNFIAVIKVSKCKENRPIVSINNSRAVQTVDLIESNEPYTRINIQDTIEQHSGKCTTQIYKNNKIQSQDLFADDANNTENILSNLDLVNNKKENETFKENNKPLIIQDSDSDDEIIILQVEADVHRSTDQFNYGVLTQIEQNEVEYRRPATSRGRTPASTDSSDKENRDPNKPKKKLIKKSHKKNDFVDFDAIQSL